MRIQIHNKIQCNFLILWLIRMKFVQSHLYIWYYFLIPPMTVAFQGTCPFENNIFNKTIHKIVKFSREMWLIKSTHKLYLSPSVFLKAFPTNTVKAVVFQLTA